jgi:hypothetical protein
MSEADLAAIPERIQKSFAAVPEYTESDKHKLLKMIWDSCASLSILNDRNDFVGLTVNTHRDLLLLVKLDNHSREHGLQYTYQRLVSTRQDLGL